MLEKSFGLNHSFFVTLHIVCSLHYIFIYVERIVMFAKCWTKARQRESTHTKHTQYSHGCLTPPHSRLRLSCSHSPARSFAFSLSVALFYDNPIITISTFQITSSSKTTPKTKQNNAKNNLQGLFRSHSRSPSHFLTLPPLYVFLFDFQRGTL